MTKNIPEKIFAILDTKENKLLVRDKKNKYFETRYYKSENAANNFINKYLDGNTRRYKVVSYGLEDE